MSDFSMVGIESNKNPEKAQREEKPYKPFQGNRVGDKNCLGII